MKLYGKSKIPTYVKVIILIVIIILLIFTGVSIKKDKKLNFIEKGIKDTVVFLGETFYAPIKFVELWYGLTKLGVTEDGIISYAQSNYDKNGYNVKQLSKIYLSELSKVYGVALPNKEWDYDNIYTIPAFFDLGTDWHKQQLLKLISTKLIQ